MKILFVILFTISCYGQAYVDPKPYIDEMDSVLEYTYWGTIAPTPTASITIGEYTFEQDSIVTMTNQELSNFIMLLNFFASGFYWNEDVIDQLCIRLLPERLRSNNEN